MLRGPRRHRRVVHPPGTLAINVATVQVSFYDAAGRVLDTGTTDVGQQVGPGQSVVTHDAEEVSAPHLPGDELEHRIRETAGQS